MVSEKLTPKEIAVKALADKAKKRCDAASIKYSDDTSLFYSDNIKDLTIHFKEGRGTRPITFFDEEELTGLLSISFEEIRFLEGYNAICIYKDSKVEAIIRPASISANRAQMASFSRWFDKDKNGKIVPISLASGAGNERLVATLGPASAELQALLGGDFSLTIKHHSISRQDRAKELLTKVADSLMFQTDLHIGTAFYISRKRSPRPARPRKRLNLKDALTFPSVEYENGPMSLYWYGRSAAGVPLLQFLAFYQVIEYFYPVFSEAEARRQLQIILKNPLFRVDSTDDLTKIINAIQINRDGAIGNERSQLKATMSACVQREDLIQFVQADTEREKILAEKRKDITDAKLTVGSKDADVVGEAAERIYDIRCRIVHTKSDARDEGKGVLLPFSDDAENLQADIELVQFVAQRVLIAASKPIRIQ